MNRAYLFPFEVEIDRSQAHRATPVNLATALDELVQAARNERLRCPYVACLERVTPVRQEGSLTKLRCFAHLPATEDSPPCPYRTSAWGESTGAEPRRRYPPEHNLRKVIENALHIELQRILAGRGPDVRIESSSFVDKEPRIRVTGLEPPFQIRGLAPGCEALWSEPFAGSVDGEEVLFFVLDPDAASLRRSFIDSHLLARRPAIRVHPAETSDGEHGYAVVSRLADDVAAMSFDTLDLLRVDYGQLFGLDRGAEYLFLPGSCRRAIEKVAARLAVAGLAPEEAKALRLYAKRLLVDGAAVHASVFGQTREEARRLLLSTKTQRLSFNTAELGLLLQNRELQRLCAGDKLLDPLWYELFREAFDNLAGTVVALQKQTAELRSKLAAAVTTQAEQAGKLKESDARQRDLESQIRDKEQALLDWYTTWKKERAAALSQQKREAEKDLAASGARMAELTGKLTQSEIQRKEAEGKRSEVAADLEALRAALVNERQRREALERSLERVDSHRLGHWMLELYLGDRGTGKRSAT